LPTLRRNDCEVAVIGAGPFGLATAAHLKAAKLHTRVFGEAMAFWRHNMPKGMFLRSPWDATHIADPSDALSLDSYAPPRGIDRNKLLPIDDFIRYGLWYQEQAVPDLDTRRVARVETMNRGFRLLLDDGDCIYSRRVVIATGLANQEFLPASFAGLPSELVSHTCEHAQFDAFRGRRVAVIGRGQSACESAALLSEAGAEVELICRGPVHWLGFESGKVTQSRDLYRLLHKLTATRSAVGPFPLNKLTEFPGLVHGMPQNLRLWFNARSLRPAAAGWLKPRFDNVRINADRAILGARVQDSRVRLDLDHGAASFDHVLLATGYRIDISRLGILAPELLAGVETFEGSPRLARGLESSVRGLHFVGSNAVYSFGPLMRFVWGAGYAARALTAVAASSRARSKRHRSKPIRVNVFSRASDSGLQS
jgi:cation diffusion facilitator CzcD-associated flavoprotein CzcO